MRNTLTYLDKCSFKLRILQLIRLSICIHNRAIGHFKLLPWDLAAPEELTASRWISGPSVAKAF